MRISGGLRVRQPHSEIESFADHPRPKPVKAKTAVHSVPGASYWRLHMKSRFLPVFVILLSLCEPRAATQVILGQGLYTDNGPLELNYLASCRDVHNNLYITGVTGGNGESGLLSGEVVTQQFDSAGHFAWICTYSEPPYSSCFPSQIATDPAGDIFIAGYSKNIITNGTGIFAVKMSSAGKIVWSQTITGYTGTSGLVVDSAGNAYVAAAYPTGVAMMKFAASNGAIPWLKAQTYGTKPTCPGLAISAAGDPCLLLNATDKQGEIVALNPTTGLPLWTQSAASYNPLDSESWSSLTALPNGNIAVGGSGAGTDFTVATVDWLKGSTGAFVARQYVGSTAAKDTAGFITPIVSDSANEVLWTATEFNETTKTTTKLAGKYSASALPAWSVGFPAAGTNNLLAAAPDEGLFVSYVESGVRWFGRVSAAGKPLWSVNPTTPIDAQTGNLSPASDDSLAYVGQRRDQFGNGFYALLTLEPANGAMSVDTYTTPIADRSDSLGGADQDAQGNVYVTGSQNRGWFVAKLSPTGTVIWRQTITPSVAATPVLSIAITYSNGFIAAVAVGGPGLNLPIVTKLNASDGQILWTAVHTPKSTYMGPQSIQLDEAGNVDVGFQDYISRSGVQQFAATTGAINWSQWFTSGFPCGAVAVDAEGDVFMADSSGFEGIGYWNLIKISQKGAPFFTQGFYIGNTNYVYGVECDQKTGKVYLEAYDTVNVLADTFGAYDIGCYSNSGAQIWAYTYSMQPYGQSFPGGAKLNRAGNLLYLATPVSRSFAGTPYFGSMCLNAANGGVVWNKFIEAVNAGNIWNIDLYGDVIFTTPMDAGSRVNNRFQTVKMDAMTGAIRFQTTYNGTFASTFNGPSAIICGPTDTPLVLGSTISPEGPGSSDAFYIRYADAHAPICVNDAYTCVENTALSSTVPSVFANDRDIAGATCNLVKRPLHALTFSLSKTGVIAYTPAKNFAGTDTFTYDAESAYGTSNVATVTIAVN